MRAGLRSLVGRVAFGVWLVLVWVVLWGGLSWANVVGGLLVVAVLLSMLPAPRPGGGSAGHPDHAEVRVLAVASLAAWFSWKLVSANVRVAIQALQPPGRSRIRTAIVAVPLPGCPPGIVTLVANIITLTPGTLTMEVDAGSPVIYVHELTYTSREAVRADVYEIERRVVAAFGSASARAASAGRDAALPVGGGGAS